MKLTLPTALLTLALASVTATAASIDMNDPRRAVGREDDIRVDAQIPDENVASGAPISITYQVENFTRAPIALAPKVANASYDADEQTITVGIGSEVPSNGVLPQLVTIAPGEKKTFTVAATARFMARSVRPGFTDVPRYVRVKVNVLRDVAPFAELIALQRTTPNVRLTDQQFDRWLESNDTIFLSSLPVRYSPGKKPLMDAEAGSLDTTH